MNYEQTIQELKEKMESMKQAQNKLREGILSTETWLNKSLDNMSTIHKRLQDLMAQKRIEKVVTHEPQGALQTPAPAAEKPQITTEQLEKLLQGSLESWGDKLSEKLMNMLKEIQTMSGPMRMAKIKELKEAADAELIDISALYAHQDIESNIEDIGVDEKETKGVDSALERLRKMRKDKK